MNNDLFSFPRSRELLLGAVTIGLLTLTACGGGSDGSAIGLATAPPPVSSAPPPPATTLSDPVANKSAPLVAGVLTPSPAPIEATSTATKFSTIISPTTFPMLQTVAMPVTFAGNADATAAGGTITADGANGYSFAVNTPAPWFSYTVAPTPSLETDGVDLDYTRFGSWLYYYPTEGPTIQGVWSAGFVTPAAAIPTSGSATYSGKTTGLYDESHPCGCLQWETLRFQGDMALTATFGARTVNGDFTNLILTGGFVTSPIGTVLPTKLNDVSFTAAIDPSSNRFVGQTGVTNQPAGPQAFDLSASGSITGMFYGPVANEVGGVWTLSDGVRRMIGSFGGRQP
jgi:hypothetical protein